MTLATRTKIAALLESKLDQNRGGQFELAYQAKIAVERIDSLFGISKVAPIPSCERPLFS